jgi:inorganic triphosphatase YgiF
VGDLRKNGIVLRIRKKGRAAPVLGVKSTGTTADSPFLRNEIEVRSPDLEPNLALFDKNMGAMLINITGDRPLEAQFETQVKRRTTVLNYGQSQVEVSFDEGCIVNRQSRVPLTEVELELKSGNEVDLYAMAMQLAEALPLSLDFVSKGEKGFRVCGKESAVPIKAESSRLKSGATVDDAIMAILTNSLAHFVANWASLRETEDPESIHQLRVALRRLRSALSMFKRILPSEFEDVR